MIKDEELTLWLNRKDIQEWLDYKCRYFTKDTYDCEELKAEVLYRLWNWRENYTKTNDSEELKAWIFGIFKYTYVQLLEQKYKKPTYKIEEFSRESLDKMLNDKSSIIRSLEAKSDISRVTHLINNKLSKNHSKVLVMSTEGYANKQIAKKLELAASTISRYKVEYKKYIQDNILNSEEIIIASKEGDEREYKSVKELIIDLNLENNSSAVYRALKYGKYPVKGWELKIVKRKLENVEG